MKSLLSFIGLLLITVCTNAQNVIPGTSPFNTVENSRGIFKYNLGLPRYLDTANANLQSGVDSSGFMIYTYNTGTAWIRTSAGGTKKWVEIGSGNTGSVETAASIKAKLGIASSSTSGYLSSTDWATFNGKANPLGYTAENIAKRGVANGYPTLDGGGKIPTQYLPTGALTYKGTWDASTNTPTLDNATGTAGWTYRVSTGGTQNLAGGDNIPVVYNIGDEIIYNGTKWEKSPSAIGVTSIGTSNKTGTVLLDANDISETSTKLFISPTEKSIYSAKQDALGYTPIPNTRTVRLNNITKPLSADVGFDISTADINVANDKNFMSNNQSTFLNGLVSLTPGAIGVGVITNSNIATGITGTKISDLTIGTTKIIDGNITTVKIADGAITAAKIADAIITNAKIADVDASKLTGVLNIARLPAYIGDVTKGIGSNTLTIKPDLALSGTPTTTTAPSTDSSNAIATTANVKNQISVLPNLAIDTASVGNTGINPIYASDPVTIKARAIINGSNYTVVRDNGDSTYHLEIDLPTNTDYASLSAAKNIFAGQLGIGGFNENYGLGVETNNTAMVRFRSNHINGGYFRLTRGGGIPVLGTKIAGLEWTTDGEVNANGEIGMYADGNHTANSNQPTYLSFKTTSNSTTVMSEKMKISANGRLSFGGTSADISTLYDFSYSGTTKKNGLLLPKVTESEKNTIFNLPIADGEMVFQTDGTGRGIQIYDTTITGWKAYGTSGGSSSYTLQGGMAGVTMAVNSLYYAGSQTAIAQGIAGHERMYPIRAGTINEIRSFYYMSNGTLSTGTENFKIDLMVTTAAGVTTGTNIYTGPIGTTAVDVTLLASNLNIPVEKGGYFELKITTPTTSAGTMPSGFRYTFIASLQ